MEGALASEHFEKNFRDVVMVALFNGVRRNERIAGDVSMLTGSGKETVIVDNPQPIPRKPCVWIDLGGRTRYAKVFVFSYEEEALQMALRCQISSKTVGSVRFGALDSRTTPK
jgi:hypothetical protein